MAPAVCCHVSTPNEHVTVPQNSRIHERASPGGGVLVRLLRDCFNVYRRGSSHIVHAGGLAASCFSLLTYRVIEQQAAI